MTTSLVDNVTKELHLSDGPPGERLRRAAPRRRRTPETGGGRTARGGATTPASARRRGRRPAIPPLGTCNWSAPLSHKSVLLAGTRSPWSWCCVQYDYQCNTTGGLRTHLQQGQVKPPDCSLASCPTNACPAAPSALRCGKPMRTCNMQCARDLVDHRAAAPACLAGSFVRCHHSRKHHGGCCGRCRRWRRRRVQHDELLQVVLVERDAIRPVCLLHQCAHSSAQAFGGRHTELCNDHRHRCLCGVPVCRGPPSQPLNVRCNTEYPAERSDVRFSISPGSASRRCGPGRRGPPLTPARGAVLQV
jgi:hypothetical protein